MKKHLANIVTGLRIIGALLLIFLFNDFTMGYIVIYCICALTDLIDGPIARKTGSASILGAILDTMGDGFVSLSMLKIFFVQGLVPVYMMIWTGVIIAIFFGAALYSKIKFNRLYVPHTYLDKIVGIATYLMPFAVQVVEPIKWMWLEAILLSLAAVETFAIQVKSKTAKDFVGSIFTVNK